MRVINQNRDAALCCRESRKKTLYLFNAWQMHVTLDLFEIQYVKYVKEKETQNSRHRFKWSTSVAKQCGNETQGLRQQPEA